MLPVRRVQVLGRDLHLRRDETLVGDLARRRIERAEEIEHRRRLQRPLAERGIDVADAVLAVRGLRAVRTPHLREAQQRLLHFAAGRAGRGGPRLGIEQDRLHDRAEVAALAAPSLLNTAVTRATYSGDGLLVTSFWISCFEMNGPTFG